MSEIVVCRCIYLIASGIDVVFIFVYCSHQPILYICKIGPLQSFSNSLLQDDAYQYVLFDIYSSVSLIISKSDCIDASSGIGECDYIHDSALLEQSTFTHIQKDLSPCSTCNL